MCAEHSGESCPYENAKGMVTALGLVFKLFGIAIALVIVLYLLANILRSSRRLDRRISDAKKEQEENAKQGKVLDPYAALAELYTDNPAVDSGKQRRKRR